mgnify:CR=1 FL=1
MPASTARGPASAFARIVSRSQFPSLEPRSIQRWSVDTLPFWRIMRKLRTLVRITAKPGQSFFNKSTLSAWRLVNSGRGLVTSASAICGEICLLVSSICWKQVKCCSQSVGFHPRRIFQDAQARLFLPTIGPTVFWLQLPAAISFISLSVIPFVRPLVYGTGCENGGGLGGFATPGNSRVEWVVFP